MCAKKKEQKCITPRCKNKRRKGYRRCATCCTRRQRAANPMRYAYDALKWNTTRRSKQQGKEKPFTITFEDFKEFCIETDYMAGKGRSKLSYTVDCIIEELGYVKGNLQRLSKSDNSKKEQERRRRVKMLQYDWQTKQARVITNGTGNNGSVSEEALPF